MYIITFFAYRDSFLIPSFHGPNNYQKWDNKCGIDGSRSTEVDWAARFFIIMMKREREIYRAKVAVQRPINWAAMKRSGVKRSDNE